MKAILCGAISVLIHLSAYSQTPPQSDSSLFDTIIHHFQERKGWNYLGNGIIDSIITPERLYRTEDFSISISNNPLNVDTVYSIIENPFYKDYSDSFDDKEHLNFPVSYSVIFEGRLVSLFRNGKFVCYQLSSLQRDFEFEKKLNRHRFNYHWIVDGTLGAMSGKTLYMWNGSKWKKAKSNFPLKDRPKLYEDDDFVVYSDCYGEWGGTVYFFDKANGKTYFTSSSCANSVIKSDKGYLVFAELNHMLARSDVKAIQDPRKLTQAREADIFQRIKGDALGYQDSSNAHKTVLEYWGITISSTFKYGDRQLSMVNLNEMTFLVELVDTSFQIVHPMFNRKFFAHDPVGSSYGNYALSNRGRQFSFFRKKLRYARIYEVSVIILDKYRIIKLDWNESDRSW